MPKVMLGAQAAVLNRSTSLVVRGIIAEELACSVPGKGFVKIDPNKDIVMLTHAISADDGDHCIPVLVEIEAHPYPARMADLRERAVRIQNRLTDTFAAMNYGIGEVEVYLKPIPENAVWI